MCTLMYMYIYICCGCTCGSVVTNDCRGQCLTPLELFLSQTLWVVNLCQHFFPLFLLTVC